jgi:hypothetical protein
MKPIAAPVLARSLVAESGFEPPQPKRRPSILRPMRRLAAVLSRPTYPRAGEPQTTG